MATYIVLMVKKVGEYDPKALEESILAYWQKNKTMDASLRPSNGELFSFLEGPPTANAPPALHHVEMRTFKDVVNRFQFMQGKSVPRKAGWDCHGLPVEVQVEKELGLAHKKDIVGYGVDKFVEKCRESVFSHIGEWDKLTERMAYWIDLDKPYVTMDNDYIESVWWSLKELWDKDLLYEGYRVVPMCSRCGTPLSSHEVALGYQTVKEQTVIVSLPVTNSDYSLLAWTTTPWTLLSNVALAVNPDVTYAKILYRGEKYVLAESLAESRFPEAEILEEIKGSDLIGLTYHPLFSHFVNKLEKPAWRVISGDFVTTEDGTGIVHIAPAFGEDDYNVGMQNDLPLINPVSLEGKFTQDIPELVGMFVKDADEKIISILEERGSLVAQFPYEHEYPFCWRCETPLLYYSMKSWFVRVADHIPDLMEQNQKIDWYPETIKTGRFGNWIENARDWALSRNRFWGTPLPIWECPTCEKKKVIGSRAELAEQAIGDLPSDIDLHRPYVDEIKLKCDCGATMSRVEYVIDCWYDSGAAPFAQFHYPFENKELFDSSFPYDFISEATDQTRGWFYTLLVLSTLVFEKPAYKSCVVGGLLMDVNGEKMSKSKGNTLDPWEMFNTVGVDAVRLQMCSSAPWNVKRFGKEMMAEQVIPMLRTLWNCYSFTCRYLILDGYDPRGQEPDSRAMSMEDKWIMSAISARSEKVKQMYMSHNYHQALSEISSLIVEDMSRWYIKLIRDRLWLEDVQGQINPSKKAAYDTLSASFAQVCAMLAPMAPFITEDIFLNLVSGTDSSVHLAGWPKGKEVDTDLNESMDTVRAIFEAGSRARQDAKIKLRYPITKVTIAGGARVKLACETLDQIIKKQLNCKSVKYVAQLDNVSYIATPDFSILGPKLGKDAKNAGQAIRDDPLLAKQIVDSQKGQKMGGYQIEPAMISHILLAVDNEYSAASFGQGESAGIVLVETKREPELISEALARDLIRHIQQKRKVLDLEEMAQIDVTVSASDTVRSMLKSFMDMILAETRAKSIDLADDCKSQDSFKFEGEEVSFIVKN